MTGGCSGGPIVTSSASPIAIGLNSYVILQYAGGPREEPPGMYSPYIGESFKQIVKWLKDNGAIPDEIVDPTPPSPTPSPAGLQAGLQEVVNKLSEIIDRL